MKPFVVSIIILIMLSLSNSANANKTPIDQVPMYGNAFVESLNEKFRNECMNQFWFRSINEAKEKIDQWRQHYNYQQLHSSLRYMPPVAFAKKAA